MKLRKIALTFLGLFAAANAFAAAPAAPSNFTVRALGVNSFLLKWKDNSNNETGWDVRISIGTAKSAKHFTFIRQADISSYVVLTNELPGKTLSFQLAAYNGNSGAEVFSKPSSVATVKTPSKSTFKPPTNLRVKSLDDGRLRVLWKDNSTSESSYQIQVKKGKGKWVNFGGLGPGNSFSPIVQGLAPNTSYAFRVFAIKTFVTGSAMASKFSNEASAKTMDFRAPTGLVATVEGDAGISLKWNDLSSIEDGYEIQWKKASDANFTTLGTVAANVKATNPIECALDTDFQFRIRAGRNLTKGTAYTAFSNTVNVHSVGLASPTNFAAQTIDNKSVRLTWTDASQVENGYQVQYRIKGETSFSTASNQAPNSSGYTVTGLLPGALYEFRVRTYMAANFSTVYSSSPIVEARPKGCSLLGDANPPIFWNTSFSNPLSLSNPDAVSSITVSGLPSGLTYQAATRTISGTTMEEGAKTVAVNISTSDGLVENTSLVLRIIRPKAPPVSLAAFSPAQVSSGSSTTVSADGKFSDPDTRDARRVNTSMGSFDIILYPLATPGTVNNFLAYANAGRYNNSFFHRSVPNFVVQGGGYTANGSTFSRVPTYAAIQNEPGISNVARTVAMAKIGNQPNSATCEFFVNISDSNAANLDNQNGGFTVFGRVAGNGNLLTEKINALTTYTFPATVNGSSSTFEDIPLNSQTELASLDPSKLVKITSVSTVPILSYEVTSGNPAIATASVNGNDIIINGVSAGTTTITVKAIDLDGESTTQDIAVTVQ